MNLLSILKSRALRPTGSDVYPDDMTPEEIGRAEALVAGRTQPVSVSDTATELLDMLAERTGVSAAALEQQLRD